jgi:hypothetical protein
MLKWISHEERTLRELVNHYLFETLLRELQRTNTSLKTPRLKTWLSENVLYTITYCFIHLASNQ